MKTIPKGTRKRSEFLLLNPNNILLIIISSLGFIAAIILGISLFRFISESSL